MSSREDRVGDAVGEADVVEARAPRERTVAVVRLFRQDDVRLGVDPQPHRALAGVAADEIDDVGLAFRDAFGGGAHRAVVAVEQRDVVDDRDGIGNRLVLAHDHALVRRVDVPGHRAAADHELAVQHARGEIGAARLVRRAVLDLGDDGERARLAAADRRHLADERDVLGRSRGGDDQRPRVGAGGAARRRTCGLDRMQRRRPMGRRRRGCENRGSAQRDQRERRQREASGPHRSRRR